ATTATPSLRATLRTRPCDLRLCFANSASKLGLTMTAAADVQVGLRGRREYVPVGSLAHFLCASAAQPIRGHCLESSVPAASQRRRSLIRGHSSFAARSSSVPALS